MAGISLSGLASGFDWQSLVTQIIQADRAPETRMQAQQSTNTQKNSAYGTINSDLLSLQTTVQALNDPTLFDSALAQSSDSTTASATAAPGTPVGTYQFSFTQMATAASQVGSTKIAKPISSTNDVSNLVLSNAGFATPVTAGTFTINGSQVTVATTDTLQAVFDKINSATGGAVTASYNASTDKISLTSASEIVLGSATDTSNFLQITKLANNGSGAITSGSALGGVALTKPLASANLSANISDGGNGAGQFTINGVAISFSATADSIQDVLNRINSSTAGVNATYDSVNSRLVLTNKATGDTGIALQDVTGNFLASTGLLGGSLQHGKNLLYTVNGGPQLSSMSNTADSSTSGINGLSVTALKLGSAAIAVSSDTNKITTAINSFVTSYNSVQNYINSQTATSTDSTGKVTASLLTGDTVANEIASKLRGLVYTPGGGGTSSPIQSLADLGINTNGQDNTLTIKDQTKLSDALTNNLGAVKALFTQATTGLAVTVNNYITNATGDTGSLATAQSTLTQQNTDITNQISALETRLSDEQQRLTTEFVNMETARSNINQQMQYLQQRFGTGSTSTTTG